MTGDLERLLQAVHDRYWQFQRAEHHKLAGGLTPGRTHKDLEALRWDLEELVRAAAAAGLVVEGLVGPAFVSDSEWRRRRDAVREVGGWVRDGSNGNGSIEGVA